MGDDSKTFTSCQTNANGGCGHFAIIQQAVGIDSILFYLVFIIQDSGVTSESAQLGALILLGLVKLLFVFVGAKLFDRYGRRPLLFASLSLLGCVVSLVVVSIANTSDTSVSETMTILALAVYLACFSSGLGPGNWVIVSEVFCHQYSCQSYECCSVPQQSDRCHYVVDLSQNGEPLELAGILFVVGGDM